MNIRDDFIELENFFSDQDLQKFEKASAELEPGFDHIFPHGAFANQCVANYINLLPNLAVKNWVYDFIHQLLGPDVSIANLTKIKLFLPFDIHADWYSERCEPGHQPYYNFLIPLEDIDSSTIIFDQTTDSFNNFSEYKQCHEKCQNPIDIDFWNKHLSMCWPEDREYVSLKHVMPLQRRGQLLGFPRRFFHSSDNFKAKHGRSKSYVWIAVNRPL